MAEDRQRRVAEDRYALDQAGIRRFIRAGDLLPDGWKVESEPEPEPPKRKSSKRAVPKDKA